MSALPSLSAAAAHDQYVVTYGKGGAVGVFTATAPLPLRRGQHVVIQTPRGLEIGAVRCVATLHQARLLGAVSAGALLRPLNLEDEASRAALSLREQALFETSRAWAARDGQALEILDVELLFDGKQAILQFVGEEAGSDVLAHALEQHFGLTIRLENLAAPRLPDEAEHGCDKPDCGRAAGGGCDTCSTGGGCSSCGSGKVDIRPYFSHLRDQMETRNRIPLA